MSTTQLQQRLEDEVHRSHVLRIVPQSGDGVPPYFYRCSHPEDVDRFDSIAAFDEHVEQAVAALTTTEEPNE